MQTKKTTWAKAHRTGVFWNCRIFLLIILMILAGRVTAQDWAKTNIKQLQRVDLRHLGYPRVNDIPENSSAITSLLTASDGRIYGGTSGEQAYLFVFDPAMNKVRHLGKIPGQQGIHHALVEDKDGMIYIGAGKNMFEAFELSKGGTGRETIEKTLWADIKAHFEGYPGGGLYRFDPKKSLANTKLADMDCEAKALGVPVKHNSIYALTMNPSGEVLYGLTYPDGHFFEYAITQKRLKDYGPVDQRIVFHGPERHWRSLPRALICDQSGRVFTSGADGKLQFFCPQSKTFHDTGLTIPGDYYYIQFFEDYAVIDYLTQNEAGVIYGGTSDGYLFQFDPARMELLNLGKVRADRRLRCMTISKNGKIYLMAGERSAARPCQLYCYDPAKGGFEVLGLLIADRSPFYYRRGQQFDAMTTGTDGTLYLGESERRSHLFMMIP